MAKLNNQRLKSVIIDGETILAPEMASVSDVVPIDVKAVTVYETSGGSRLIPRSEFNRPLPEGFTTHLTHVEKGALVRLVATKDAVPPPNRVEPQCRQWHAYC